MAKVNLSELNQELKKYLYKGYDLYFLHGWFCAYLSAPSDSEDDLLIPTYLILDEDQISDEEHFSSLVDQLVDVYKDLADAIYEKNKLIKPILNLEKPGDLNFDNHSNLLNWLYGYLTCHLVVGGELDSASDELLEERFYPALFTLCVVFFSIKDSLDIDSVSTNYVEDFDDVVADLLEMWESDDISVNVQEQIASAIEEIDFNEVVPALNDLFYVVRTIEEDSLTSQNNSISLLNKITKH